MSPPALTQLRPGLWMGAAPVSILGMPMTSTMSVVQLADGSLLVHSPIELTPERRAAVEALGPVSHLFAPNLFHHLRIAEWVAAFPSARLHAPSGLVKKRPDLRVDRVHASLPEPAFAGSIVEIPIAGCRLGECALYCTSARALILADLVQNVGRPAAWWPALYTRLMGFYDRVALSRAIRLTGFFDKAAARRSIDALLELPFDCLVVGHGAPLDDLRIKETSQPVKARAALAAAFEWLPRG